MSARQDTYGRKGEQTRSSTLNDNKGFSFLQAKQLPGPLLLVKSSSFWGHHHPLLGLFHAFLRFLQGWAQDPELTVRTSGICPRTSGQTEVGAGPLMELLGKGSFSTAVAKRAEQKPGATASQQEPRREEQHLGAAPGCA